MSQTAVRPAAAQPREVDTTRGLNAPEIVAFFLLLVIAGVRPLVGETYESAMPPIVPLGTTPTGPGPVFPLTMGSLVLVTAALTVIGWLRHHEPVRRRFSGLLIGGLLIAIGMVVSLFVASNRRLALNASSDWLLMIVSCALLVWLLRHPWQVRLLLCVLIATAAAFAVQCLLQRFVEYRDMIAEYEAHKTEFWQSQNVLPEDPKVQLYERRLHARDASGYFPHSNVAGSLLLLGAWAAAALAVAKLRGPANVFRFGFGVLTAVLAVLLFASILLTGSRGAVLAGILTAALVPGWLWITTRVKWGWRGRLLLGWLVVLATAAAVVLYARVSPSRSSMGFRWDYWRNTTGLLRDYFWTGVGAQNFDRFYLQYKPITDPEEIRDPHNFFLTAFAQWGVTGALGIIAIAVGVSIRLARPPAPGPARTAGAEPPDPPGPGAATADRDRIEYSPLPWFVALASAVFALRLWTILGNPAAYLVYATIVPLIVWSITLAAMTLESNRFAFWSDAPISPTVGFVLVAGVLAFLLHGMIDMGVFYPGTASTFFVLLAAALAIRQQAATPPAGITPSMLPGWLRFAGIAVPCLLWLGHLVWLWLPPAAVQMYLAAARRLVPLESEVNPVHSAALAEYRRAVDADALDPTPPTEAAEWLLATVVGGRKSQPASPELVATILDKAGQLIHTAQARDPREIGILRTKVSIDYVRAQRFGSLIYARAAVGGAKETVSLYPESPQDRILLAETLTAEAGLEAAEFRSAVLEAAIGQYEQALRLDAARPGEVELRRWPRRVRGELEDRIDELKSATARPTSQPASEPTSRPTSEPTTASSGI
jgi:O-antigen ligase